MDIRALPNEVWTMILDYLDVGANFVEQSRNVAALSAVNFFLFSSDSEI